MDLKDFQNVEHSDDSTNGANDTNKDVSKKNGQVKKKVDKVEKFVDTNFHDESDKIIKELEARIAAINKEQEVTEKTSPDSQGENEIVVADEEVVVDVGQSESFIDKIKPFILPICLTLFALLFAALFMYFFSQARVERSAQAIVNNQSQPEVIIIKEEKPKVEEVVVVPEQENVVCDLETQILNEETNECEDLPPLIEKVGFENGTTTVLRVRFSFDKFSYDNHPRGIYLLGPQVFGEEDEYEDYKLLADNRAFANDMFFGIDRYMVSLIGACRYVVDDAEILVSNTNDSGGVQVDGVIGEKYFRGKVEEIISSSKPHIVCNR